MFKNKPSHRYHARKDYFIEEEYEVYEGDEGGDSYDEVLPVAFAPFFELLRTHAPVVYRVPHTLIREPPVGAAGAFAVRFVVEGAAFFAEFVAHFIISLLP